MDGGLPAWAPGDGRRGNRLERVGLDEVFDPIEPLEQPLERAVHAGGMGRAAWDGGSGFPVRRFGRAISSSKKASTWARVSSPTTVGRSCSSR